MFSKKVLNNLVGTLSSTSLMVSTVYASEMVEKEKETKNLVRPRDLSIYSKPEKQSKSDKEGSTEESALLAVVRQVREGVWAVTGQLNQVTDQFNHVIDTGKAHTSTAIQTLRDDENYAQRYGAIAAGGLLGYLVAIRRGWFRRILYTTTGATAVAAICYPEEANQYRSEGFREGKRYVIIAYHFVNGGDKKKQGTDNQTKNLSSDVKDIPRSAPKTLTFVPNDPGQFVAEKNDDYSSLYTRRGI